MISSSPFQLVQFLFFSLLSVLSSSLLLSFSSKVRLICLSIMVKEGEKEGKSVSLAGRPFFA